MADYVEDFGFNNIPFGIASSKSHSSPQCVSRIGNSIIFLAKLAENRVFEDIDASLASIFALVCQRNCQKLAKLCPLINGNRSQL
jgi:fumarylacetoacetase